MVTIYYTIKLYDELKLGGLIDDACYLIFSEVKKEFGLRSILQDNHGRVSHLTHSSSNFPLLKEVNNCFRMFWGNGENKSKTLKTDQPIGRFNLSGFGDGTPSLLSPSPTVIDKEDGGFRLHSQPLIIDRRLSGPRIGPDTVWLVDPRFNF